MKVDPNEPMFPAMDMNNYHGVDRLELRYSGLDIRTHMAIEFTKALMSNSVVTENTRNDTIYECVNMGVFAADELIKQLNTEQ